MKILNDILSPDDVLMFKNFWNNHWEKYSYVNWEVEGRVLDRRLSLQKDLKEFHKVKEIVERYFKDPIAIWAAYQQQNFAHQIHIDDYATDTNNPCYTIVFSMDTIPEFKTIVWKEVAENNVKLKEHVESWGKNKTKKISNISELEDLEHTLSEEQNDYFADYLNLDGIYTYKAGSGVLFNARQYHCTSNWTKYPQFSCRELLQIHIQAREHIDI